ncbi:MAG: AmmeMemoRadiSam system protein A, partial [Anaerolineaceae bacterium]|nr:AmmeMemoRadiSam system protein A [Anaerolineaceae bacterium]
MTFEKLTEEERKILLELARLSMVLAVADEPPPELELNTYSLTLQAHGASFVTLTEEGNLRGCIGTLEPHQPLVQDVCEHAAAAATEDYRFPPVQYPETSRIQIGISRLTPSQPIHYEDPLVLPGLLRPGVDGVTLRDAGRRATFLPQVWEKVS